MLFPEKEFEIFFDSQVKLKKINSIYKKLIKFLCNELESIEKKKSYLITRNDRHFFKKYLNVAISSLSINKYKKYSFWFIKHSKKIFKLNYGKKDYFLPLINFLIKIFLYLKSDDGAIWYKQYIFEESSTMKIEHSNYLFKATFFTFIKQLKFYSIQFDFENKIFVTSEIKSFLDNIDNELINNLTYSFLKSENLTEMYNYVVIFSKTIYPLLNNSNFNEWWKCLNMYFDKNKLKGKCDGYFRHSINDNISPKYFTKEWEKFSNEEKKSIMQTIIFEYLSILSILRNNGYSIQMIWENQGTNNEK